MKKMLLVSVCLLSFEIQAVEYQQFEYDQISVAEVKTLPPEEAGKAAQAPASPSEPDKKAEPEKKIDADKKTEPEKKKEEAPKDKKPEEPAFLVPLSLGRCGRVTFKPGARIQVRYEYDTEHYNHDFFIRRFRLKGSGDAFGIAKYGTELKIDNVGRYRAEPKAEVENAWIDFTLCKDLTYLRVGLYDLPFSRDALTSDSKLLFMDRTLIKEQLTSLGLADNTIGLLLHGRPNAGRFEYAVGIFDNIKFEKFGSDGPRNSHQLMPAGRFVVNFLDPAVPPDGYADYEESYIGKGQRLAIGVNAAYLGGARDEEEDNKFDLYAYGADLFFNRGPFTFQAEYDLYHENDRWGYGWYVQTGYLFCCCIELAARYQELMPISHDRETWASIGLNKYIRQHNLKIQTDYTFKRREADHENIHVFEIQLQLDF